jgi:hypothetical protein
VQTMLSASTGMRWEVYGKSQAAEAFMRRQRWG